METEQTTIATPDTKAMELSGKQLYDQAMQLEVIDNDTLLLGDSLLGAIKSRLDMFKPGLDEQCNKANSLHKFLTNLRTRALAPFTSAESEVKRKMLQYNLKLEEKRRKEAERIAAEAQRKAEEERAKQIAEAKKLKDKEALRELKAAPIIPEITSLPKTAPMPKLENTSFRDAGYGFRVDRPDLLPRKYLIPDEKAIAGVVKALGKNTDIPGITVFPKDPTVAKR